MIVLSRPGMRNGPDDVPRGLVFAHAVEHDVAKEVVVRPRQIRDLDHHLRPDPMHARKDEG